MFYVYILFSESLGKYYVGSTNDVIQRLTRHNAGESTFSKKGIPWKLIQSFTFSPRSEAVQLEKKIKKRGIERFLKDNNLIK